MNSLRKHVLDLLRGGLAYETFDEIVGEIREENRGIIPPGAGHSPWQILSHMNIALRDILDFTTNEDGHYVALNWPDDYWPKSALPEPEEWQVAIDAYKSDLSKFEAIVEDPTRDILAAFTWGDGQTILREAHLAAAHEAYHLGELVQLNRWLNR